MKFLCVISGCPEGARKWHIYVFAMQEHSKRALQKQRSFQSVKEHVQQGADKRAAGELEGARPASNTINRRPKVLIHQRLLEQNSILIISKCSADEACQKKSSQDFFDKLQKSAAKEGSA